MSKSFNMFNLVAYLNSTMALKASSTVLGVCRETAYKNFKTHKILGEQDLPLKAGGYTDSDSIKNALSATSWRTGRIQEEWTRDPCYF